MNYIDIKLKINIQYCCNFGLRRNTLNKNEINEQKYVRASKAHEIIDVSKTTFWRMTKESSFPKKRKIMGNSLYSISELIEWIDSHAVATVA